MDHVKEGDVAILVQMTLQPPYDVDAPLDEFIALVQSTGTIPAHVVTGARKSPDAKYFIGSGKLEELQEAVRNFSATFVLFNHELTPAQERNLESVLQCSVVGRTGIILDIFAQRARTAEGKLQVELAQLQYTKTRLVRGWMALDRQKGGIGLRGPGETQLETDRRLIGVRIAKIERQLSQLAKHRALNKKARKRAAIPTIAVVGYTNAGKSTLFNRLTGADVYAADQLFATLDPTLRHITLPGVGKVMIADTVGFIRHLPHKLVEAFQATLQETQEADWLLHVVDSSAPDQPALMAAVKEVLREIGAQQIPQLLVYNKIDNTDIPTPRLFRAASGLPHAIWASARTGAGISLIQEALVECLGKAWITGTLILGATLGKLRAQLYGMEAVTQETIQEDGSWCLMLSLPASKWQNVVREYPDIVDQLTVKTQRGNI